MSSCLEATRRTGTAQHTYGYEIISKKAVFRDVKFVVVGVTVTLLQSVLGP